MGSECGSRSPLAHATRRGDEATKQTTRYRITLADDLMAILRWCFSPLKRPGSSAPPSREPGEALSPVPLECIQRSSAASS